MFVVFVLGVLVYMLVGGISYVEFLFKILLIVVVVLLVVVWVWNLCVGFFGIGLVMLCYMLLVGMLFE